ncbi:glutamyl-tRNA reductase [Mucisphaera sp.]|uniref:glutamyl-tRNA reductase n=1 Tax=Mucisphaera sp. TaxID=2913024 RepID=UPI003D0D927D
MSLGVLTLDYRQAGVDRREGIARRIARTESPLTEIRAAGGLQECALISTCNRVEVYGVGHGRFDAEAVARWLEPDREPEGWQRLEGREAIAHLMRVASGIESMVLGEPQILGQVRCAYHDAREAGTAGTILHAAFQRALAVGKMARQSTGIGEGRVSVASIAVAHVRGVFDHLAGKTILSVGAGHMCKAMLRSLETDRPARVLITNRSAERARLLAESLGPTAEAWPWDRIDEALSAADVVLCGTGSSEPVLDPERCKAAMQKRRQRPQVIVDVAVPRDVDPAVADLPNVFLANVDQLQTAAAKTLGQRADSVSDCEKLIASEADALLQTLARQEAGQVIRRLRQRIHKLAQAELDRTRQRIQASLNSHADDAETILEEHTRRLLNKILHLPVSRLGTSDRVNLLSQIEMLEDAFQLDEGDAARGSVPGEGAGVSEPEGSLSLESTAERRAR